MQDQIAVESAAEPDRCPRLEVTGQGFARTIARIPALIATGSPCHAATTHASSSSSHSGSLTNSLTVPEPPSQDVEAAPLRSVVVRLIIGRSQVRFLPDPPTQEFASCCVSPHKSCFFKQLDGDEETVDACRPRATCAPRHGAG